MFSIRSTCFFPEVFLRAARHPADSDWRPTAGAQVLARVPKVPWHPYHSGPALHFRVPSRSERCSLSKSDRYFFVVVDCDKSYLLSVELLSCLVLFLLEMQGNVNLNPPIIRHVMHQVLSIERNSLRKYWDFSIYCLPFGCLVNCTPDSPYY